MKKTMTKTDLEDDDNSAQTFQRFEDLAKILVAVPKEEIDQAEKDEKQAKKQRAVKHA